jgi:hypothetical protein
MDDQLKMKDFLKFAGSQKEPALLVIEDPSNLDDITGLLDRQEFRKVSGAKELMQGLEEGNRMYIVLAPELSKELYDAIVQFPTGGIEVQDSETFEQHVRQFDPNEIALVIVSTRENLDSVEKNFGIRDKVGVTEIIS